MTKVHPKESSSFPADSPSTSTPYLTMKQEVYTIWMKSLVMNSYGCTVYDSNGEISYRIDNYDSKGSDKVYLMDLKGQVLCTILKKKLRLFGRWEGYQENCSKLEEDNMPWFQVRKPCHHFLKSERECDVTVKQNTVSSSYTIRESDSKLGLRIVDQGGVVVAEMKQKQSNSGLVLGNDVFTLTMEPNVDRILVMGLVVVHGLMNRKL